MSYKFPSDEWIKELKNQLNTSPDYERSAKNWEGDFVFIVEPDESYKETKSMYLDLHHGKSRDARLLSNPSELKAAYTISATYSNWRKVIEGKLDPIQGMLMRKLKLEGNLMQVLRYPKAAQEIVACCGLVPTDFQS
jgi:putative sterol carrier protein